MVRCRHEAISCCIVAIVAALLPSQAASVVQEEPALRQVGRRAGLAVDWMTLGGDRIAVGSSARVRMIDAAPSLAPRTDTETPAAASQGVLVGDDLYLAVGNEVLLVDLAAPLTPPLPVPLSPVPV